MVSVVTNGSKATDSWFKKYGKYLDMVALSIDSFDDWTNLAIGRHEHGSIHADNAEKVSKLCRKYNVLFKMNTVVNNLNWQEDMREHIRKYKPMRWKVFQCLLIEGENMGPDALRNAEDMVVTQEQFDHFVDKHRELGDILVPEDNDTMRVCAL